MAQVISADTGLPLSSIALGTGINKSLYSYTEVVPEFFKILKWCIIPIIAFVFYWFTEKYIVDASPRLVYNPAEFPCRFFGFSHYLVGFIYMMSSRKMKAVSGWLWFIGLLTVSIGGGYMFFSLGGRGNQVLVIFYFLFFMIHGYRDMVFFYKPETDEKELEGLRTRILLLTQVGLILGLMYVLVPAFFLYMTLRPKTYSPELQASMDTLRLFLNALLMVGWIGLVGSLIGIWRLAKKFPGGLKGFWVDDKPVLLVIIYTSLIILATPLVGPWTYNLLILSHFVGWYFFASRRLSTIPKQATRQDGFWKWVRGSVSGFQTMHLGFAAVFLILILINHYVFASTGILELLFSSNAFYYWTIVHVTISFAPKN